MNKLKNYPSATYTNSEQYLAALKYNLKGCDRSLIQDAMADAKEYFRTSMDVIQSENENLDENQVFQQAYDEFGNPEEIAEDYRKIDKYLSPRLGNDDAVDLRPWWKKFLMIIADPMAWGSVLYMLISLLTGIFFFVWVATGLSISLSLLVLIIGLPILGLYLLSIRGLAVIEGRIVEALLGTRMPRRAMFLKMKKVFGINLWS